MNQSKEIDSGIENQLEFTLLAYDCAHEKIRITAEGSLSHIYVHMCIYIYIYIYSYAFFLEESNGLYSTFAPETYKF